ncbi:hypothetical protein LCGC14_0511170 [marine sediment metagenome]|uniref:Uncharacterized protein n=1 Tax=marine sediment metagenome TaxID=412755 RepID=A0A0F9UMN2_9ZZZZ
MISPTSLSVRPYKKADRATVLALVGNKGVIDTPTNKILVLDDGAGCVVWSEVSPFGSDLPGLGGWSLSDIARLDLRDKLLLAVCDAAMAAGHKRGHSIVTSQKVLDRMKAIFIIDKVTPVGRNVKTGKPGYWEIEFDLAENRAILLERLK